MASVRKRTWTTAAGETRTAWAVDIVDSAGKRERRQFSTKREADAFRVQSEGQIRSGTYRPDGGKVTVAEATADYLKYCEGRADRRERMTRTWLYTSGGMVRKYLLDPKLGVGGAKLAHLTAGVAGDFRDRLRGAGVSVQMVRKILSLLCRIVDRAVSRDLVATNSIRGVRVIAGRGDEGKKVVPPSKADMKRMIEGADENFRIRLQFAAASGCRAGELHALRWRHLDLSAGSATIETRVDRYGSEDVTKTAAGMRSVPLSSAMITILKGWKLRSKLSKPDHLVFPNGRGGYVNHSNMLNRDFYPLCEALGIGDHVPAGEGARGNAVTRFKPSINWHGLRHFAISTWIEAGLAPKVVQTFAGHSSLAVTMDRYGHLFPSQDHRAAMDRIAQGLFT